MMTQGMILIKFLKTGLQLRGLLKQTYSWDYCKDIRKYYITEKLGSPEPNPPAPSQ